MVLMCSCSPLALTSSPHYAIFGEITFKKNSEGSETLCTEVEVSLKLVKNFVKDRQLDRYTMVFKNIKITHTNRILAAPIPPAVCYTWEDKLFNISSYNLLFRSWEETLEGDIADTGSDDHTRREPKILYASRWTPGPNIHE